MKLTLPFPPSTANHAFMNRGRYRVLSPEARGWRDEVIVIARQSGEKLPDGALDVRIDFWPRRLPGPDADNLIKQTVDAIFAAFGENDHRVWRVSSLRHTPDGPARIQVRIEEFTNATLPGW